MSFWTGLLAGLLGGWLIEWVIDWVYWRRRYAAEMASLREENARLRGDLATAQTARQRAEAQLGPLNASLQAVRADNDRLQGELAAAQRLTEQRMSELESQQVRLADADSRYGQLQGELAAAQESAQRYKAEVAALQARLATPERERAAAGAALNATRQVGTGHTLVGFNTVTDGEQDRLRAEIQSLRATLAAWKADHPDPLIDINGIGPVYQRKLYDAGIYTFADLADLTPERIREIIAPEQWQDIQPEAWIAGARLLAQKAHPDPLIDINGIGPVYQRKLYDAGIYTFAQLATLTIDDLQKIVDPQHWQDVRPEAWIAEARQRAQHAQERGV